MRTIASIFSLCLLFVSCSTQKETLMLHLEKGATYKQSMLSEILLTQSMNGEAVEMKLTLDGNMQFQVTEILNDTYEMQVSYERLDMGMQMQGMSMNYSSTSNDPNDIMSTMLGLMEGVPFNITMSSTGKILSIKNIDTLYSRMFEKFPELPQAQLDQISEQLKKSYGEAAFKGNMELVSAIFPDHAVSVGDTWHVETQLESGMAMSVVSKFTLKEMHEDHYILHCESMMQTLDKEAYVQTNGMPLQYNLTGTMTNVIKVNKTTGWVIEAKISQKLEGNAYIKDNPMMPGGMEIPMTMINEMTITDR